MKKVLIFILSFVMSFSYFCVENVLAENQNIGQIGMNNNQGKDKLSELLYTKMINSSLSFLGDDNLKNGIDKFFNNPKFYVEKDNVIFIFNGNLFGENFTGEFEVKINISELKILLNEKVEYEGDNLSDYIIFEQIGENKKLSKNKKYIALTFDDGPSKANTPILLDILKKNNVKVTFFVLGQNVSKYPDIIKEIDKAGHEIGSHSRGHPKLTKLSEDDIYKEVNNTDELIYSLILKVPKLFRPPYGEHNETTDKIIDRTILLWSVDSTDWKLRDVEKNIEKVKKDTKEGSIILMHDIHKTSVDSVNGIIKALKNKGFEFVTVSELLEHYQNEDYFGKTCYSGFNCK